ncbi:MAG: bifunctional folylpolyglutamate synthase/dihydrofolate synthase [Candidatus Omnitrophica bacterium]|nr:bifunctional folylpolyglutamate synthase/dihydrofolate synthase [Candidatus Omnitrophota bacterium]
MLYSEAITYLGSLCNYEQNRRDYDFGLKRIKKFLQGVGNPQREFLSIHIAGSNGKGAVGNLIYSILKEEGYRVGFFSSPHLISIRERIRASFNSSQGLFNDIISRRDFADLIEKIAFAERTNEDKLTFFETLTAAAFLYFAAEDVDLAVIETGLGGRLDATNVLNPLICVLSPIALEHYQELGNSLTKIAREKVGIIKRGACVISAPQKEEVRKVIEKRCGEKKTELFEVRDVSLRKPENTLLALKVLEKLSERFPVSQKAIKRGFKNTYWPGRLERISITKRNRDYQILLDGAHNPSAAEFLKKVIERQFPFRQITLIFSACRDKDIEGISRVIFPICKRVIFTRFKNPRCETIKELRKRTGVQGEGAGDIKEALELACKGASTNTLILITGSLYLAGEALQVTKSPAHQ